MKTVPLGEHTFTLAVDDGRGGVDTDSVTVVVRDTRKPKLSVHMSPSVLWPPNGEMVPVVADVTVSDTCDPNPRVILVKVTNSDDDDHHHDAYSTNCDRPWIEGAEFGTDDRAFSLRAEHSKEHRDRVYTVFYTATDASGNGDRDKATVVVPHHKRHRKQR